MKAKQIETIIKIELTKAIMKDRQINTNYI